MAGSVTDANARRELVETGRPLDATGDPLDGPALAIDPGSEAAALLRSAPRALAASPGTGTWATLLERPGEGSTDRPVLVQWLAPDAVEPPPHVHPASETFHGVEGELTLVVGGEARTLGPGETATVPAGREHTFRNGSDETVAVRAELPSMRTARALFTVWGLDHEAGSGGNYDGPGPVRTLLVAEDAHDDTTVTAAPVALQRLLWATAGRLARLAGYSGIEDRFLDDGFWERHVEQPDLPPR